MGVLKLVLSKTNRIGDTIKIFSMLLALAPKLEGERELSNTSTPLTHSQNQKKKEKKLLFYKFVATWLGLDSFGVLKHNFGVKSINTSNL